MDPSLGLMVGLPIGILVTVLCLIFGVGIAWSLRKEEWYWSLWAFGLAIFVGLATAGAMYPFKKEYHYWQTVSGQVTSINKRLLSNSGGGMDERFVLHMADGRIRSCDDTRCAGLKVGDTVELRCKKKWQYQGTDGWDCNWAGRE